MKRNERYKAINAECMGVKCRITAHKRLEKNKKHQIVYIISNRSKIQPKKQVKLFDLRWNTEKFFRTAKQSLGITDCQFRSTLAQNDHIYSVMASYAFLEREKNYSRKKSPKSILHAFRFQKESPIFLRWAHLIETFVKT